jgi:hypothetical protein
MGTPISDLERGDHPTPTEPHAAHRIPTFDLSSHPGHPLGTLHPAMMILHPDAGARIVLSTRGQASPLRVLSSHLALRLVDFGRMQRENDQTDWRDAMKTHQEQPGDSLETSATRVHDGGIGVKDASESIVEARTRQTGRSASHTTGDL